MPSSQSESSPLCLSCGICCDGTLFTRGKLDLEEIEPSRSVGLEIVREEDKEWFRIPCPRFVGGCCTVYAQRPGVCAGFRCALLRRLEEGELDLGQALERVVEARRLQREAVAEVPEAARRETRPAARNRLVDEAAAAPPEQRPSIARKLLKVIALDVYLERWFQVPKEQKSIGGGAGAEPKP